jgi:Cu/Ag efflux protein CusF
VAAISNDVTGKITDIKRDSNTLKIEDLAGKTYSFKVTDSKTLEGLKVGDMVKVTMEEGKATSIQKVENAPSKGGSEGAPSNY